MKRPALLAAVVLALAAGVFVLWPAATLGPAPLPGVTDAGVAEPPPDTVPPAAIVPTSVLVREAEGQLLVQRGGSGQWRKLAKGERLAPNDVVRTATNASAELVAGDHVVRLLGGTDVTVQELTKDLSGFLVGKGLVGAEARATEGRPPRVLEMRARDTDATVRASEGRFRMSANGEGLVAVGVEEGSVKVSGAGKSVVLKQGERTLVRPNAAPADPIPFASELLVDVAWPGKGNTNKRVITVTGRTDAGALVFALGKAVSVREDGTFRARLKLREGKNRIRVEALDVSGNKTETASELVVNTRGAESRFNTDDLWGQ